MSEELETIKQRLDVLADLVLTMRKELDAQSGGAPILVTMTWQEYQQMQADEETATE